MSCSFSVITSNDSYISPSSYCLVKHVIRSTNCSGSEIDFMYGYGIEVSCKCRISGQEKAVDWKKRKATTFLQEYLLSVYINV